MKTRLTLLAGAAVGYVFGTKAGRQRYEQIRRATGRVAQRPEVQHARDVAATQAGQLAESAKNVVGDKVTTAVHEGHAKVADRLGDKMPPRLRPHDDDATADSDASIGGSATTGLAPVGMVPGSGSAPTNGAPPPTSSSGAV